MSKMLYVPTSSSTLNTGGFQIEEITALEYTPVGNKDYPSAEPRKRSLLKIIINKETLYFFDNIADDLNNQIENYLQSI